MEIPKSFCDRRNDEYPVEVETVSELITALKRLPGDLKIETGFNTGAHLIVWNADKTPHLELCEIEEE